MENTIKPVSELEKYLNARKYLAIAMLMRRKKEEEKINSKIHMSSDFIPLPEVY